SSSHQTRETSMTASTRSAVSMLTDFFASDDIEATARRSGFVKRASKITGKIFLETIASLPGFGIAPVGHVSYSAGTTMHARRTQLGSVRGRIDPIPPKG